MNKILFGKSLLKKLSAVFVSLIAIVGISAVAYASFGPSRPTYTWANPADHITFNSITDNPVIGDERAFVKGAVTTAASWSDPVNGVKDGDIVALQIYVHNNAASNLGLVATNTTVRVALPSSNTASQTVTGYVRADNATPQEVYDTVDISSLGGKAFTMSYIPGSAKYTNNVFPGPTGIALPDSIITTGTKIGYESMNGRISGCGEYSGVVYLKVKISIPNPAYRCDALNVSYLGGRKIKAEVNTTANNGAVLSDITYSFGDGSADLVTANTSTTYTYTKDGTYTIKAVPSFKVGGQTFTSPSDSCVKQVSFRSDLPNTGPGSVLGIFVGVSVISAFGYRLWAVRRSNR